MRQCFTDSLTLSSLSVWFRGGKWEMTGDEEMAETSKMSGKCRSGIN